MKHEIKNEKGQLTDYITYTIEEVNKAYNKATNKLCDNITVPGFRKGKAPVNIAKSYIKNDDLVDAVLDALLGQASGDLSNQKSFTDVQYEIVDQIKPSLDIKKFSNTEAEIQIVWTLYPQVTNLGEYKSVSTNIKKKEVSKSSVDAELKKLAEDNADLIEKEKPAETGDTCNIDFEGFMNGKKFDGGSAKGYDIEIGSQKFVPGFEEKIIGHKADDKFDVNLTMPENYPEPLNGKEVTFKVVINSVKIKDLPKIDDDFATTLSGDYQSNNLAELKTKIEQNLTKKFEEQYKDDVVNDALKKCRSKSSYVIAKPFIDQLIKDKVEEDTKACEEKGLTLDEYLNLIKKSREDYDKEILDGMTDNVKGSLIYNAIAKAEKVPEPTNEDLEKELGQSIDSFVDQMRKYFTSSNMKLKDADNYVQRYLSQIGQKILNNRIKDVIFNLNTKQVDSKDTKEIKKTGETKSEKKDVDSKPKSTKAKETKVDNETNVKASTKKATSKKSEPKA